MSRIALLALSGLLLCGSLLTSAQENPQTQKAEEKKEAQKPDAAAAPADLAKAVQNPVASLISVPLQNFVDYNIGPYARNRDTVLQFQPVIPAQISENWNLITRVIGAFVYQPDFNLADPVNSQRHYGTFGFGDLSPTFYLSPTRAGKLIWGAGPTFIIPTATDDVLGSGKFSLGPSVVALTQPGNWTLGVLVSNVWSVAGSSSRADVNAMTLQYFVNYNLKKGYFLTSQPIITTNWNATNGNVWLVPVGGGIARIFRLGAQPVNASIQAYYNVKRFDSLPSPTWQLKFQFALLFPKATKK
jgi:hypothetical protein